MERIVILGGGFGGVYTALYLQKRLKRKKDIEIALVNKDNYFTYQPMLAEVVGGSVGVLDTVSSIRSLIPNARFFFREIESIDLNQNCVELSPKFDHSTYKLHYDHLVFGLGNVTDFHDSPGLHEHALPFKNLADALVIRNRVIDAIEAAANEGDAQKRRELLTFVVGGGGFSGTEVVAEVNDLARKLADEFPQIDQKDIRVVLVHSKDRLLEREMNEKLGNYAGKLLQKRGVEIIFGQRLVSASPHEAILDNGDRIDSKTIISSVPSSPNPIITNLNLPLDHGKIKTDGGMLIEGHTNLWAIGDCALVPLEKRGGFCPPTAQFAIRQAKVLANNICAAINGGTHESFDFKALGMLGALGHHRAVAELFGKFRFSGIFAWMLWRMIYWVKLPGVVRKIKVAVSWMLDMLIPNENVQLKIAPTQGITKLHFEKDDVIFHEGDIGDYLYIIVGGSVEVSSKEKGRICDLKKGEFFGEMALLNENRRNATIRSNEPTDVLALRKTDFGALIANFSQLRESFEQTEQTRRKAS